MNRPAGDFSDDSSTAGQHGGRPEVGSFIDVLVRLRDEAGGGPLTLGSAATLMRGRGEALLLLLLDAPFLLPIPLPGLSTPLGLIIALGGLNYMLGREGRYPAFVMRRKIPQRPLQLAVGMLERRRAFVERIFRRRASFMFLPVLHLLAGACLLIGGIVLALPLPIPLTNFTPAIGIAAVLIGLIERDGVYLLIGQVWTVLVFAGTLFIGYLVVRFGWEAATHMLSGWSW